MSLLAFIASLSLVMGLICPAAQPVAMATSHLSHYHLQQQDNPKYKLHEAATLSGIQVKPNPKTGTYLLAFDQLLTETGWLQVKNTAGKVLFARSLQPARGGMAQILDIGRLSPGLYSIEVKTAATTFWKKIRIRK